MHDTFVTHVHWLKDWWHVITGVLLVMSAFIIRLKRQIFASYPTHSEMNAKLEACKNDIVAAQEDMEIRTEHQYKDLYKHIDGKFDHMLDLLVQHMNRPQPRQ